MFGTPAIILVAAFAPSLAWAALVVALDRRRPRPCGALLAAFAWGVAAAVLVAAPVNDLLLDVAGDALGTTRGPTVVARAAAPVVEELAKGAGVALLVVLAPRLLRTARDGIVFGALVGLGFDLAENLHYLTIAAVQGGFDGLLRGVWVRGILGGPKHAVFTASVGAGLGWGREHGGRARWLAPVLGATAAVLQHAAWNGVASEAITRALCGAPAPAAACLPAPPEQALFLGIPLIMACCLGPGVLVLAAVARRARR